MRKSRDTKDKVWRETLSEAPTRGWLFLFFYYSYYSVEFMINIRSDSLLGEELECRRELHGA